MSEEIKDGKMNVLGVNVDIGSILGDKVVDQVLAQITPEQMEKLIVAIQEDLFHIVGKYNVETGRYEDEPEVTRTEKNSWGRIEGNEALVDLAKKKFNARYNEELSKKIEEIIASEDYQKSIDKIAHEIVDYSVEGYKKDMICSIRNRMVGATTEIPYGTSLRGIIQQEISQYINR